MAEKLSSLLQNFSKCFQGNLGVLSVSAVSFLMYNYRKDTENAEKTQRSCMLS
jgi:hypothetical protein